MKYPQSVHIPTDVEHWLKKELEAYGINGIICTKYILSLLTEINSTPSMENIGDNFHENDKCGNKRCSQTYCNRHPWDIESFRHLDVVRCPISALKEKCDIEKLVDELYIKLKEIQINKTTSLSKTNCDNISLLDSTVIYSDTTLNGNIFGINDTLRFPSCSSMWTLGLLHDSDGSVNQHDKMDDYFSSLFYENQPEYLGFEFTRIKSDERQDGKERDRISFYNKQNLVATECTERLYERNTDVDKLIAKFDANIEGIWKPPYEPEDLSSFKYETFLSENMLNNSYLQDGSSLIWSFGQNGNDLNNPEKEAYEENTSDYKPMFSAWSKFTSPVLTPGSNFGLGAMLDNVNLTLSNVQKWSAMDGQNDDYSVFLNRKISQGYFTEVVPKSDGNASKETMNSIVFRERNKISGEEDLLTSTKTHFRPIRVEEMHANQTNAYADGTTFAISNELEKVTFTRSNSGMLYLDTDGELETPRKYMEYKEREISTKLFDSGSDLSVMEEFIPKFRIRQSNEKCCQTEDVIEDDQIVPSLPDTDCESDSYECDADEFFFPGDSELAENIVNKIDDGIHVEFRKIKSDCNYNDIYVTNNVGMDVAQKISDKNQCICSIGKNWHSSSESYLTKHWSDIWCQQNAFDGGNYSGELPTKDEYFRFREELTQEGEQLLSDLSCLQQLYSNSKWCDDESASTSDFNDEERSNEIFCSKFCSKFSKNDVDWNSFGLRKIEKCMADSDQNIGMERRNLTENVKISGNSNLNQPCYRSFKAVSSSKERKRLNSTNQKVCNICFDTEFHPTHRSSSCDSGSPHLILADISCRRGRICNISKNLKRPLSF